MIIIATIVISIVIMVLTTILVIFHHANNCNEKNDTHQTLKWTLTLQAAHCTRPGPRASSPVSERREGLTEI